MLLAPRRPEARPGKQSILEPVECSNGLVALVRVEGGPLEESAGQRGEVVPEADLLIRHA